MVDDGVDVLLHACAVVLVHLTRATIEEVEGSTGLPLPCDHLLIGGMRSGLRPRAIERGQGVRHGFLRGQGVAPGLARIRAAGGTVGGA